jgi:hypothetical protein
MHFRERIKEWEIGVHVLHSKSEYDYQYNLINTISIR